MSPWWSVCTLYLSHASWSYRRRLGSLLLWAFVQCVTSFFVRAQLLPIVCWFCRSAVGLILFQMFDWLFFLVHIHLRLSHMFSREHALLWRPWPTRALALNDVCLARERSDTLYCTLHIKDVCLASEHNDHHTVHSMSWPVSGPRTKQSSYCTLHVWPANTTIIILYTPYQRCVSVPRTKRSSYCTLHINDVCLASEHNDHHTVHSMSGPLTQRSSYCTLHVIILYTPYRGLCLSREQNDTSYCTLHILAYVYSAKQTIQYTVHSIS